MTQHDVNALPVLQVHLPAALHPALLPVHDPRADQKLLVLRTELSPANLDPLQVLPDRGILSGAALGRRDLLDPAQGRWRGGGNSAFHLESGQVEAKHDADQHVGVFVDCGRITVEPGLVCEETGSVEDRVARIQTRALISRSGWDDLLGS